MLVCMGTACIMNARRCGRTHCRFTGPFLIAMATLVVGYAIGMLPLGPHGWRILGGVTLGGFAALWWGSERAWGMFSRSREDRKSVGVGKSGAVGVDFGGRRIIKKKKRMTNN